MGHSDDWDDHLEASYPENPDDEEERGHVSCVDRARERLEQLFKSRPQEVFCERQLQVHLEDEFFHWVTSRALQEMAEDILGARVLFRIEKSAQDI